MAASAVWEGIYEPMASEPLLAQIRRLQELGLLIADPKCLFCQAYMVLRTSSKTCDGYAWACINRGCAKRRTTLSIRHGSVFSYSRVTLFRLFKLIFLWAREIPIHEALDFVGVARKTIGEMYSALQKCANARGAKDGGGQCYLAHMITAHQHIYTHTSKLKRFMGLFPSSTN
ncbi:hypothetical protein PAPHI01_2775 [Pancytospora philotis]|nr:hypothetical protein PAPHI01_2775 [Pancytospora philotis]